MPRSFAARFVAASLLILPILLAVSAYMLDLAFRRSLLSGEEEQLRTQVYLLLGAADFEGDSLVMPEAFQEPRLNQLDSGLYGFISTTDGVELWRSPSARLVNFGHNTPLVGAINPGATEFTVTKGNTGPLFLFYSDVAWELGDNHSKLLRLSILHNQETFNAEISGYRNQLWRWLSLLTVLIIAAQTIILRWGLRPLQFLAKDIEAIESGKSNQLSGEYPTEIQPVTENFNRVLVSEQQQRERYRNTLNDLAHSLKTPLAVVRSQLNESGNANDNVIVSDQIERMNQIISHQLARAVYTGPGITGKTIAVLPVVMRLTASLQKVYREKNISVDVELDNNIYFSGDERDLMELLGNIIDNAFKYGKQAISIAGEINNGRLRMTIADDGAGIPEQFRQVILRRGARADTAIPGQGIGLAVAIDIVSSYQGSLEVKESSAGGAAIVLSLPGTIDRSENAR